MKFEIFTPIVIHELGHRSNQEDSVFPARGAAADTDRLFLVCDGMGGHAKGEVASTNVIDSVTAWIKQRTLPSGIVTDGIIGDALQSAHQRLDSLDDGAENKMGTTLTMVCLHRGGVAMGHVGDSRIYHIRPSQHKILYKSIDHSLVYDLYRNGIISYEDMATSPQRNVITRAIMPGDENNDKIDITHTTNVLPGDYFYLCSDGMLEQMTDDQLLNVLCSDSSDMMKASALVSMTEGNKDNHTALLIKIKNVIVEPGDENLLNDEQSSPYNEVASKLVSAGNVDDRTSPSVTMSENAAAAQSRAAVPAPPDSTMHSTKSEINKKGVNRLLLLLVILLLALVAGGIVYFLLNKNSSNVTDADDDTVTSIEKSDHPKSNGEYTREADYGDDEEEGHVGTPIKNTRHNNPYNANNSSNKGREETKPTKTSTDNGNKQISPDIQIPTNNKTEEKTQNDISFKDRLKPKNGQNKSQKLQDNITNQEGNQRPPQRDPNSEVRGSRRTQ